MNPLTPQWMKTPRSTRDLLKRLKSIENIKAELRRLQDEGHEVLSGFGYEDGNRRFYWVTQERDTRKQKHRERMIGGLGMHDIKEYER